ncbi:hypothetical protein [Halobacterium litoreum]|uniref:Uncharacterized protein n=1 Tax=Halobacterium litoreum TaxID=2039234 RepID=A0ABD5NI00_9EURY|nr:hypothetical protein [Halobacterium litoreum]UHH12650.1 hypothetical protein LT972_10830 [Halobacterium litoreum]
MEGEQRDALVADVRETAGDALRCVAEYDQTGYDVFYERDGLETRLERLAEDIHADLVLQEVGREHLEDLFDAGSLRCSMYRFDDLTAFHFLASDYTGLFVSVDSDADVPLCSFADACRGYL